MTPEIAAVICTALVVGGALAALVISRLPAPKSEVVSFDAKELTELKDRVMLLGLEVGLK